jgi:integrase
MAELTSEGLSPGIFGSSAPAECRLPQPHEVSPLNPPCPRCGCKKLWRDGLRNLKNGQETQRWLCRVCGYRFSDPNAAFVDCNMIEHVETVQTKTLKTCQCNNRISQICVNDKETKNLAAEPQKTEVLRRKEAEVKGRIVEFSFWMLKQGYSEATIKGRIKLLNRLVRLGANLDDEESVKEVIAKQQWSPSRRVNAVDAYDSFLKMQGLKWSPPIYRRVRRLPFIPTESEIDQLIAATSKRTGTFLQMLKETGMRSGEATNLRWTDIDFENGSVRVTPEKHSNPRILKISSKLACMLNEMPKDTLKVFNTETERIRRNYCRQRMKVAVKLKNSRLRQITFHTFRHWKATMEYHKTKDILYVKEILGHKTLNSTLLYTQLVNFKDDEFTARVARSEVEVCQLIEAGFEFVCDYGGNKVMRRRK